MIERNESTTTTIDERLYQVACSFPALQNKGVKDARIPGITPNDFFDITLSKFLYEGDGGMLSHGEFLLLEFLLNLANPLLYPKFNLGDALQILDDSHMTALVNAIIRIRSGEWEGPNND